MPLRHFTQRTATDLYVLPDSLRLLLMGYRHRVDAKRTHLSTHDVSG